MPIYCFVCELCGEKFEALLPARRRNTIPACACGGYFKRDFTAEVPVMRGDIPPGFDTSIGMPYSGRRDKYTKYRESGHYPVGGGGHMGKLNKTYYGDEEYHRKVMQPYGPRKDDGLTDSMLAKQMDRLKEIDDGSTS